jgi:hypothetical protein
MQLSTLSTGGHSHSRFYATHETAILSHPNGTRDAVGDPASDDEHFKKSPKLYSSTETVLFQLGTSTGLLQNLHSRELSTGMLKQFHPLSMWLR